MIGSARMINPIADGIVRSMTSRMACASAPRNSCVLPIAALRETSGNVDGRDRDAENSERKLHEPKGNVEPGDWAVAQRRGEAAVHGDVYLHRAGRDRGRTHQRQDLAHAGIAPVEVEPETKTDVREAEGTWTSNCRRPPRSVPSASPTSPRCRNADAASPVVGQASSTTPRRRESSRY